MDASSDELIARLRQIEEELDQVSAECELADGHLLHEWSARLREHSERVWPTGVDQSEPVPAWALNLPYVAGALAQVAMNLQGIEDARISDAHEDELAARDRVYMYAQFAKAGAWCLRRALIDHAGASAS